MVLKDLGHGNGGTVSKVRHVATNTIMARKVRGAWIDLRRRFPTGLRSDFSRLYMWKPKPRCGVE